MAPVTTGAIIAGGVVETTPPPRERGLGRTPTRPDTDSANNPRMTRPPSSFRANPL